MSRDGKKPKPKVIGSQNREEAPMEIRFCFDSAEDIERSMAGMPDGMRDRLHDAIKKRIELIKRGEEAAHDSTRKQPPERPINR